MEQLKWTHHEDEVSIPGLVQWVKDPTLLWAVSYGVGLRHSLDLELLWLWCRPAAVAPIRPLPWEPPYAVGVALKTKNKEENDYKNSRFNTKLGTASQKWLYKWEALLSYVDLGVGGWGGESVPENKAQHSKWGVH